MKKVIAAAALAALASSVLPAGPSMAHQEGRSAKAFCKSAIVGAVSVRARQSKAKQRARDKWVNAVRHRYGNRYANPHFADARHYHCRHKLGTWRCRYSGRPCNQSSQ